MVAPKTRCAASGRQRTAAIDISGVNETLAKVEAKVCVVIARHSFTEFNSDGYQWFFRSVIK